MRAFLNLVGRRWDVVIKLMASSPVAFYPVITKDITLNEGLD